LGNVQITPAPTVAGIPKRLRYRAGAVGLVVAATEPVQVAAAAEVSSACGTTVVGVTDTAAGRPIPTSVAWDPLAMQTAISQMVRSFAVVDRSHASAEPETPATLQA
jgi:hypothetical protein